MDQIQKLQRELAECSDKQRSKQIKETIDELVKLNDTNTFAEQQVSFEESSNQSSDSQLQQLSYEYVFNSQYYDVNVESYNSRVSNFLYQDTVRMKASYKIDSTLWKTLKPYQQKGVKWMLGMHFKNNGCLLADEPGLGKSVQTIAFLSAIFYENTQQNALLVCPATLVEQWAGMFHTWCFATRVCPINAKAANIIHGDQDLNFLISSYVSEQKHQTQVNFGTIFIISYHQIVNHKEEMEMFMRHLNIKTAIFDEVHLLKNQDTKMYKALKDLPLTQRIGLSGTPIQNSFFEIYSILNFLHYNALGYYPKFKERYIDTLSYGQRQNATYQQIHAAASAAIQLREMVKPFVLRRLKRDVEQNLPPKFEFLAKLSLSGLQETLYVKALSKMRYIMNQTGNQIFVFMNQLQQLVNHPVIYAPEASFTIRQSSKCLFLVEQLVEIHGFRVEQHQLDQQISLNIEDLGSDDENIFHEAEESSDLEQTELEYVNVHSINLSTNKTLIFSSSIKFLRLISKILIFLKINYLYMDGQTAVTSRNDLVQQFNSDNTSIFLLSSKVGGVGLNLIAANHIFLMQPNWNPSIDQQSLERSWRIGQTRLVKVYRVVCTNTIDDRVLKKQFAKINLSEKVLNNAFMNKQLKQFDALSQLFVYERPSLKKQIIVHEKLNDHKKNIILNAIQDDTLQMAINNVDDEEKQFRLKQIRIEDLVDQLLTKHPFSQNKVFNDFESQEILKGVMRCGVLQTIQKADSYAGFEGYDLEVDFVKDVIEIEKHWIVAQLSNI